jgi:hypothetical protein
MRPLFAVSLVLALAEAAAAELPVTKVLRLPVPGGEQLLSYDPNRISEADLTFAASLSPRAMPQGVAPHSLERCLPHDARYHDCGSRDVEAATYLSNGEVNVRLNQQELDRLGTRKVAPELLPALVWLRRSVAFYADLEEHRLAFLRSHDPTILSTAVDGIEPKKVCASTIAKVRALPYGTEQARILKVEWHDCMSTAFSARHGEVPAAPWEAFLRATGTSESFVKDKGD